MANPTGRPKLVPPGHAERIEAERERIQIEERGGVITCPQCKGDKVVIGLFPVYAEDVPLIDRKPYVTMPCDRCNGTGQVPAEMMDWISEGRRLKALRLEPYRGIREEAERRGMEPSELSRMETGKIKPVFPE